MDATNANKAAMIATGIKIGVPIVAIGVGVILIKRMFKKNPDGTSTRVAPSLKDTVIQKENLTITPSDAALFANTLYGAMLDFGTDEATIFNTMERIKTKDDMLLVIKTFGMKMYLWGTRAAFLGQDYNLIGWFRFELSDKDIEKIKVKFDQWGIPI
nr:hypothetical protein [uncultured Carboxylicivirga sp.]